MAELLPLSTRWSLPNPLRQQVDAELAGWQREGKIERLWQGDASLWTGQDEAEWLGWLHRDPAGTGLRNTGRLAGKIGQDVLNEAFRDCVLLGMGGSSLCPEVLSHTFGHREGTPAFHVLDSADPAQVRALAGSVDPSSTLVIVSSKSGGTLEPNLFLDYFLDLVSKAAGPDEAPRRFVAITDPGSPLELRARNMGFRHVVHGVPSIGGRFSALSAFGLVPAAIMGIELAACLDAATAMMGLCRGAGEENPGLLLGLLLGVAGRQGRDKVTLMTSTPLRDLGSWLEQLLAESTGKNGKGLIPVDLEAPGSPEVYGDDRVFIAIGLTGDSDPVRRSELELLERAGHPVMRIEIPDIGHLGAEFFRWEFATAVAGSVLGVNPFNQPDVEASKVETRKLTELYETSGHLPPEEPFYHEGDVSLFADETNLASIRKGARGEASLTASVRGHLSRVKMGDYVAILAYLPRHEEYEAPLMTMRQVIRDRLRVATSVGFGPRYLHSTGQVYKGGPATGVFIQVTWDDPDDLPVPGRGYTFGLVEAAQARGDFQVLVDRGRRAIRIHLGSNARAGLDVLEDTIREALR